MLYYCGIVLWYCMYCGTMYYYVLTLTMMIYMHCTCSLDGRPNKTPIIRGSHATRECCAISFEIFANSVCILALVDWV